MTTEENGIATEKKIPSTRIGDVARLMADDTACPHSTWFTSRYRGSLRKNEDGHRSIETNPKRTSMIRKVAATLEARGEDVYPALRNGFEARGSRSGARVTGRPDIIARDADGGVTVYDVRDGGPNSTDETRVKLCMYLLPRSNHGRWRRSKPHGCVTYSDGTERRIAADEIDEEFTERVTAVMREIASDEPARYTPSAGECGQCALSRDDCSERVESDATDDRPDRRLDSC